MNKLDFHIHTFATKTDESAERNCPSAAFFVEKLSNAHVQMCAITNHNYFNYSSYKTYSNAAKKHDIVVLPGVELDVKLLDGNTGHCLVVCNPSEVLQFNNICKKERINNLNIADTYIVDIHDFIVKFSDIDCIFICHYGSKAKNFTDKDVDFLKTNSSGKIVFVEPTNLISSFIYLAHNKESLVGSDNLNWNNYPGKELPEAKISINSYEKLKLLLQKDSKLIKAELDNKKDITPVSFVDKTFSDLSLKLHLYNDINIIFGGKSTGKSIILQDIKNEFINRGLSSDISSYFASDRDSEYSKAIHFEPTEEQLLLLIDQKTSSSLEGIASFSISNTANIFTVLKEYNERIKGELEKKIGFVGCTKKFDFDEKTLQSDLTALKQKKTAFESIKFEDYMIYLNDKEQKTYKRINAKIIQELKLDFKNRFVKEYSKYLANKTISNFKNVFTNNKGVPSKPNTVGLLDLYININNIRKHIHNLKSFLEKDSHIITNKICDLDKKGIIQRKTTIEFNPEMMASGFAFKTNGIKLSDLKNMKKDVDKCIKNENEYSKFIASIGKLSKFLNENIAYQNPLNLIGYQNQLIKMDGSKFDPSNGERSVIVLGKALNDDKSIYIFDEPELSVGHDYVNRVIIPRLKQLAKQNKIVIISTHDANIAVRTLPYLSIYREENSNGTYSTYLGNPFSGKLVEYNGKKELDWKKQTLETLEGGEKAFGEREVAYGE